MPSSEFSVLLLAWDEADPSVAVLGGAALPPTQRLVYHLAARQPVLALYPHLPAAEESFAAEGSSPGDPRQPLPLPVPQATPAAAQASPATSAAAAHSSATAGHSALAGSSVATGSAASVAAVVPPAGVRLLPMPTQAPTAPGSLPPAVPALVSRMVGLDKVAPALPPPGLLPISVASSSTQATKEAPAAGALASPASAAVRNQWPAGDGPATGRAWQLPAAPYQGSAAPVFLPPPAAPPAQPLPKVPAACEPAAEAETQPEPPHPAESPLARHPLAGDLSFDPDPELPAMLPSVVFEDSPPETGPAEAAALAAPDEEFHFELPAPVPAANPVPAAALPVAATVPDTPAFVMRGPALDGLNARMIAYARRAAHLANEAGAFGVIYAPNWPTWLAALEIRYRLRRPLVLYLPALAADFAAPAEQGWLLEIERFALRRAHTILVPDEALRQRVRARYGSATGRVRVVAAADEAAVRRVLAEVAAR